MPLDFSSTEIFRNELLRRNLRNPYGIPSVQLPISYNSSYYEPSYISSSNVIESEKISDRSATDLANNISKNGYNDIIPYVYPTIANISIVLNRRGIYPLFTEKYKYREVIGKEPVMDSGFEGSGDSTGGFTWRSTKIKNPINPKASSLFDASLSTNYSFTDDSILNMTQQILNATPKGASGRGYVGNAIDQTSRIFFDGTKMISKGSAIKYVDKFNGTESGAEYGRVWTKDKPYLFHGDTMKRKGNIRKFTESILDSPYNLNIAPQNGSSNFDGSTNIQRSGDGFFAKKYMFSIENLAWSTSNRNGFSYEDLPYCERGANGGRVMWFPPYGLQVSENNSAKWNDNSFLGRIEPVYTYQGAERSGTLSFKVVVDHPSVLNLLVRKKFQGMSDAESNNYIMAFFTGVEDVDLYELARKYTTLDKDDIERILAYLHGNKPTTDVYKIYRTIVPTVVKDVVISTGGFTQSDNKPIIFFKHNTDSFFTTSDESTYTTQFNNAATSAGLTSGETALYGSEITTAYSEASSGISNLDKLIIDVKNNLNEGNTAVINIDGGSAKNESSTSTSRIVATKSYILQSLGIAYSSEDSFEVPYVDKGMTFKTQLHFKVSNLGSNHNNKIGESCESASFDVKAKNNSSLLETIANSFYCRSVNVYASFTLRNMIADKATENIPGVPQTVEETFNIERPAVPSLDEAKRILMKLLSECYYFDAIKEDTPHIFASMKEKLKYFHPAFHSTTPEGLNSRLTFLLQCTRPGDTIPTVQVDGTRVLSDARNTSFGSPPVCIMRIGDFYHSKVIIRDVNINYEENIWDMNPEGIGFQPMIANVSMNVMFIGGQGLKTPVSELQNALSSNFYANTEMYDYRATATEDRESFNKKFLEQLVDSTGAVKKADIIYPSLDSFGNPIGSFKIKDRNSNGEAFGILSYTNIINNTITALNDYGKTAVELHNFIYKKWGKTIASAILAQANRKYTSGTFIGTTLNLFGIHNEMGSYIDTFANTVALDIRDMNFGVFAEIKNMLTTAQYDIYKNNYESDLQLTLTTELASAIKTDFDNTENSFYKTQKPLINLIDKMNLVNNKVDGLVTKETTKEFTLSAVTSNIMSSYFTQHLGQFNTLFTNIQNNLDNVTVDGLTEDSAWRVNVVTSIFTDSTINNFMNLFEGLGQTKLNKIKEKLKNYLKSKDKKVDTIRTIVNINKTVEFPFTENTSTPNASTIQKVFASNNAGNGTTYNYSNLI